MKCKKLEAGSLNLLFALCGLVLVVTPLCQGQNRNAGEIRGTVVDNTGAVVPGVSVDAVNVATGNHIHGITGSTGVFDLPYVESGEYTVTFTKETFEKFVQTGVKLHVETITINATLQVGSVATEVKVTAAPQLLQTETSELSTVLPTESVSETPNVGRNWTNYIQLLPGAAPTKTSITPPVLDSPSGSGGQNVGINGAQQLQSSWLIDGGTATLPDSYNPAGLVPPIEAIAEIDISTGNFGAESGNGLSTFNVITKNGTNRFHGQLSEFVQNDVFNAAPRNFSSAPQTKPPVRWNMYGGSVGGPIIRDKLFFFFAYQANPTRSYTTSLYTFPTDSMRIGDFSDGSFPTIYNPATTMRVGNTYTRQPFAENKITSIDSVAAKIQSFFPEPNAINPANPDYNNYYFSGVSPASTDFYDFRVDGNVTQNNHMYVSGLISPASTYSPSPDCPIDCWGSVNTYQLSSQLTDVWTFSPTKLNEFRVAVAREYGLWEANSVGKGYPAEIGLPDLPADTFPVVNVTTGPAISIGGSAVNAVLGESSVVVSDTFNWIFGKHTVKVGGEYDNWTDNNGWQTVNAGTFNFSGIATRDPNSNDPNASPGVGYADFLLGSTNSWNVSEPIEYGEMAQNIQLFAQDYYKIRSNLTINYGVRFLRQGGWTEEHNRRSNYVPTLTNPATGNPGAIGYAGIQIAAPFQATAYILSPRVGFSYLLAPSWTVRGGFGTYAIPWSGNAFNPGVGIGWTVQGSEVSSDNLTPVFQLSNGPPPPVVPTNASRTPALLNGQNVTYAPYNTPIGYSEEWQFGIQHQMGNYLVQANYVGTRGIKTYFATDINQVMEGQLGSGQRPNPTFQQIDAIQYNGSSNYNALQLTAKRQFTGGFSFLANYTFAKALDTGTAQGGNSSAMDNWQNAYSPAANYAASAGDIRHTLSATALYQLPFGKHHRYANRRELADVFIGGWEVSPTIQFRTGSPFTPVMANNLSGALSGTWYPNRTGRITVPHPNLSEWFNVDAFTAPAVNTFGDSRRNILYGPHFADVDFSLAKSFAIQSLGDASSLQLKLDTFDLFNHPNYGEPNATIGSAGAGVISSATTNRALQIGGIFRF